MTAKPDQELKKAFMELQAKLKETSQQLFLRDVQIQTSLSRKEHLNQVVADITSLPKDTTMYESVGRAFFYTPRKDVISNLKESIKEVDEKIDSLKKGKEYLQRSLGDSENNLRDLIQQKKKG